MKYINCSRCRARFHTGVIYESLENCPRCGGQLLTRQPRFPDRLRGALSRRAVRDSVDWEAVTGSQYVRRSVLPRKAGGDSPATV